MAIDEFSLVYPAREYLPGYMHALEHGWSPDNRRPEAAGEALANVHRDAEAFLATLVDMEGKGAPIILPDGTKVKRLPGYHKWMWDGEFCGDISIRWQPGTTELPPHCLGHVGYSVVPWKRRKGYATRALALMLTDARAVGLPFVEITTDVDNVASRRVIETNGGVFVEEFVKPGEPGAAMGLRFRIQLQ